MDRTDGLLANDDRASSERSNACSDPAQLVECLARVYQDHRVRLIGRAKRFQALRDGLNDEEDLVMSAIGSLLQVMHDAPSSLPADEGALFLMLMTFIRRKAINHWRRARCDKRDVRRLVHRGGAHSSGSQGRKAEWIDDRRAEWEVWRELLESLFSALEGRDPCLRDIARLRIDGHSSSDIADRLGIHVATVYRKLQYIGRIWLGIMREDEHAAPPFDARRNAGHLGTH